MLLVPLVPYTIGKDSARQFGVRAVAASARSQAGLLKARRRGVVGRPYHVDAKQE